MTAGQLTTPHPHVHLPHRAPMVAGVAVAAVVAIVATGVFVQRTASTPSTTTSAPAYRFHADRVMPGEFVLSPGNLAAVGVTVPLGPTLYPARGEFRLGPGNSQPVGIINPIRARMTPISLPTYSPGEFALSPGNAQPLGVVVPAHPDLQPVRGEFRLGPGNSQPAGITVPLGTTPG